MTPKLAIRNILATFARATPEELDAGATWYARARAQCELLSSLSFVPLPQVCGVVAALSPSNRWERNLLDAATALRVAGYDHSRGYATYAGQVAKAQKLAQVTPLPMGAEEILDILGKGLKTRAFFHNILFPSTSQHVTVDGHAANIARGKRLPLAQTRVTPREYAALSAAYIEAAAQAGALPTTMQATTWVVWRRVHAV